LLTPIVESTYLNRDMCKFEYRKKTKADGSRLIPRKHTETLVLLSVDHFMLHKDVVEVQNVEFAPILAEIMNINLTMAQYWNASTLLPF